MTLDHLYQVIDQTHIANDLHRVPDHVQLHLRTVSLFNQTRFRGKMSRLWSRILRHPTHVSSLSDLKLKLTMGNSYDKGLETVRIDQIIGSVSKCEDFDANFAPISERSRQRWARIASLFYNGEAVEAVELIQVGDRYFVKDGHHRISVSKALGKMYIDAHVTVLQFQEQTPLQTKIGLERNRVAA